MKSPIKNLTKILLNDHNFKTSVTLMNKHNKWSEVTIQWRQTEEETFFQIWNSIDTNSIGTDIEIYKCKSIQAMYKKLKNLINTYDLVVFEINRNGKVLNNTIIN